MTSLRQSSNPQIAANLAIPQSTSSVPIALPALPVSDYTISAGTLAAARTDYAYSNNQGGRILKTTYVNPLASTAAWTVVASAAAAEVFNATDFSGPQTQFVLQPGESRTMITQSTTSAEQV